MKKSWITLISFCLIFCMTFTACTKIPPQNAGESQSSNQKNEAPKRSEKYAEALSLIEKKDYKAAYVILKDLGDYEDAEKYLSRLRTVPTSITITNQGKEEYFYNENGLLSKHIVTDFHGRQSTAEFTYDQDNNLLRKYETSLTGEQAQTDYTYDENGKLICKKITKADGSQHIEETVYNKDGRVLKVTVTYADGKQLVSGYLYDIFGYPARMDQTGPDDGNCTTVIYTYDHDVGDYNRNLIKKHSICTYTADNGSLQSAESIWECDYDAQGNPTMEVHTDIYPEGNSQNIIEYTYDGNGNLKRKVTTDIFPHAVNGTIRQSTACDYTYDENGLVIQMDITDKQGAKSTFTFAYDENGNMIKETSGQRTDLCTYDESGRMTKLFRTQPDGTTFSVDMPSQWIYLPEDLPESTESFLDGYFNRNYRTPIF